MIGAGLLRRAGREAKRVLPASGSRVFVVTSPNVRRHWGDALEKSLRDARLPFEVLEMHDGEPAKKLQTVEQLAEWLVDAKADRKSLLVAFGGGVVGDSAGFLAAIFMRGIPVVQIPTTVVAQGDASIGGKTGVNLRGGKNLVGSFHQPSTVLVDPDLLETLDEREFRSGLFESLKCGVIRDRDLFDFMERNPKKILGRDSRTLQRVIGDYFSPAQGGRFASARVAEVIAWLKPCDLVIVEGYKSAHIPKIEARRRAAVGSEPLAGKDPNVIAIAADHAADGCGRPVFALDDVVGIADFIATTIGLRKAVPMAANAPAKS